MRGAMSGAAVMAASPRGRRRAAASWLIRLSPPPVAVAPIVDNVGDLARINFLWAGAWLYTIAVRPG